jgi:hypothetical protein
MLKKWNTFNESVGGRFTEEMAMEIVYYFSEDSEPSKSIEKVFLSSPEAENLFHFYDSGYDEYKEATQKLYSEANKGSLEFRDNMFQVYNMIREERSAFPIVAEIEDIFLDLIDDGYSFVIYSNQYEYKVKVQDSDDTLDDFIKRTKSLGERVKRLNVYPLKATLSRAERSNGFYNEPQGGKDTYVINFFEILIRRVGWKKSGRGFDDSWSPE